MRLLTDALPLVVAYIGADLRYRFVNATWEQWFGRPREVISGRTMAEILDPDAYRAASPWFERVLRGEKVSFASVIRRVGEEPRHVEVTYAPDFDDRGGVRGFIARMLDVTAHMRAAVALGEARDQADAARDDLARKAHELQASNGALEQFGYVVSHDLQEPLRMVAQYLSLLEKRAGAEIDEKSRGFISYARDGALRMQQMIDDLLRYARAGRVQPIDGVDLSQVMDEVRRDLSARIAETGATLTAAPLPRVRVDRTAMRQVLQNLIANALKFAGTEPALVRVEAVEEDHGWRFAVVDNGIGIDPANCERVFEVFQRLHTRDEYPGNGIGLAICRKIVEQHGGRIWVESAPGRGSRFNFTLPRR
ncbi:MAG: PAS domain-containing protein [Planctomycetes bacterium]|nr:PAS domain-containing protein [Planctomycetota bacterium]